MNIFLLILCLVYVKTDPIRVTDELHKRNDTFVRSRRILGGHEVGETRPYMVYLRAAPGANPGIEDTNWLCGGVIVHERYILTSAACIENAKQFFVVSGMHRWIPNSHSDECITNGAKKAVWKCVPKSYYFDGDQFDNIRWMIRDIAVVKVEDDFNFKRRVRGCDFIPSKLAYNNISEDLEKTGTHGSVAGWGSTDSFADQLQDTQVGRAALNSPELLEADVEIMSKKNCKNRWDSRYHHIIDEHMICVKDMGGDSMSLLCTTQEVNCTELVYSMEENEGETRRFVPDPSKMQVHTPGHGAITDIRRTMAGGGFCENDHGGPLVVGHGKSATVVGIVSACQTFDVSLKCHGPFLYTSVYKNRHLINCAITKEMGTPTCRRLLRSTKTQVTETFFNWPEGPPQIKVLRTEELTETTKSTTKTTIKTSEIPEPKPTAQATPAKHVEHHHY